jgi:hypothetical protein
MVARDRMEDAVRVLHRRFIESHAVLVG